jgi:cobalt-zinc-cadmium efflux system membrane fusion protein
MTKSVSIHLLTSLAGLALVAGCSGATNPPGADSHASHESEDDYERGPNGGRMLRDGALAMEVTLFEAGGEPQFRLYPYLDGEAVASDAVDAAITLTRLGGRVDTFRFRPEGPYLIADGAVAEPHSFDVEVTARLSGFAGRWTYESHEGRTVIPHAQAEAAGIRVGAAGPATLIETIDIYGVVDFWPHARAEVRGWLPGRVAALDVKVGDVVVSGQQLAQITASESLQTYAVTSPFNGVILEQSASIGGPTGDDPLYVVADPSQLHAELFVYPADLERLEIGQVVTLESVDGDRRFVGEIGGIMPTLNPGSQRAIIHVDMPDAQEFWRAGEHVRASVQIGQTEALLAVETDALQRFRDFTVVYARVDETYEIRMLELGRRTADWTEVIGGLEPGEIYVTDNPFLITADILKSGASHDH